jgi:hypothetical protein
MRLRRYEHLAAMRAAAAWHVLVDHPTPFVALLGLIASWFIPRVLGCHGEACFRFAGLILQLGGIGLVANGIHETRVRFQQPALREQWRSFLQRLWAALTTPSIEGQLGVAIPMAAAGMVAAVGTVTLTVGAPPTLEDRLRAIEEAQRNLQAALDTLRNEVKSDLTTLRQEMAADKKAVEDRLREFRKLLEEEVAGGLNFEMVGLSWLLVGTLVASIPAELAGWLHAL